MARGPLGRIKPPDFAHVEKYPLSRLPEIPTPVPVVLGVNWYDSFDSPRELASGKEGTSYHLPDVAKGESLGSVRGGHCFCLEPMGAVKENREPLRVFYDQGSEGACVGFGHSRAQSILRGYKQFDAFWLYDEARRQEGSYPEGEGSTCRAAMQALAKVGQREQIGQAVCQREIGDGPINPALGIKAYRWATSAQEVLTALGRPGAYAVPFQNSWGDAYPAVTWLPTATLERLLSEEGEADIETPR